MGGYVSVGPVSMFHELAGDGGDPVVLLHGAMGGAFVWGLLMEGLASDFRLFAPEQRGRARTPDVEGPYSFADLAEDTLAFIDTIVGEPVHVVGASDGGIIGLAMAFQQPGMVRSLTTFGANYHYEGVLPEAGIDLPADDDAWTVPRTRYGELSPDGGDHWPVVYDKVMQMAHTEPTWTLDEMSSILTPVLVAAGDDDIISIDHTVAHYQALPNGRLAIIPGASHTSFLEHPTLVEQIIRDFISDPGPPETMMPIRRA